jgi:hypothetical protein
MIDQPSYVGEEYRQCLEYSSLHLHFLTPQLAKTQF